MFQSAKSALRDSRLFAGLHDDVLGELAKRCQKVHAEAGEVIVQENGMGRELYLIKEGRVRIVGQHGTPYETIYSELAAGEFFANQSLGRPGVDDRGGDAEQERISFERVVYVGDGDEARRMFEVALAFVPAGLQAAFREAAGFGGVS